MEKRHKLSQFRSSLNCIQARGLKSWGTDIFAVPESQKLEGTAVARFHGEKVTDPAADTQDELAVKNMHVKLSQD
jgi:hypothetical protein